MLRLRDGKRRFGVGLIASDMDRTLTDPRLRVVRAAIDALREAKENGVKIVLATGRTAREMRRRGAFFRSFDAVLVEGGALVGTPGDLRPLNPAVEHVDELEAWLEDRGIDHRRGRLALSVARPEGSRVRRYRYANRFEITPNHDRLDITLAGVTKGAALRHLLSTKFLDLDGRCIAFGDGENDTHLFRAAGYGVAVGNAVDALKDQADEVIEGYGGRAVARFLEERLLPLEGARKP